MSGVYSAWYKASVATPTSVVVS